MKGRSAMADLTKGSVKTRLRNVGRYRGSFRTVEKVGTILTTLRRF